MFLLNRNSEITYIDYPAIKETEDSLSLKSNFRHEEELSGNYADSLPEVSYKNSTHATPEVMKSFKRIEDSKPELIDDMEVYTVVEIYPSFPGGELARIKFLQKNIRYPADALKNKIEGQVIVNFIIEKDGSMSNIKVLKGIGGGCDEEALRVTYLMPKWKPGFQSALPVRVNFNMPVTFRLSIK